MVPYRSRVRSLAMMLAVVLALVLRSLAVDARPRTQSPIVHALDMIARTVRVTRYTHTTHVDVSHGRYEWDCSAMATWVLRHAAPDAERSIERTRRTVQPLARDYHAVFSALPAGDGHDHSWRRVTRLVDAEPGDVVAWVFPPWVPASITGHVAFVVERPVPLPGVAWRYWVRVADATSVPHAHDTRPRVSASGFGYGDIEFTVEGRTGAPTAYRWNDLPGRGFLRTSIAVARPVVPTHRAGAARTATSGVVG